MTRAVETSSSEGIAATAKGWLGVAGFVAAYFAAHQIAFFFPASGQAIMAFWPVSGIGLSALLLYPSSYWPVLVVSFVLVGVIADVFTAHLPFVSSIGYLLAGVLESTGCAALILRVAGRNPRFDHIREVLALIGGAVFINALTASLGAYIAGQTTGAPFRHFWFTWWVSNGLGILLVTPVVVSWSTLRETLSRAWRGWTLEFGVFLGAWVVTCLWVFGPEITVYVLVPKPYMLTVLLIWAALRLGPPAVSLALLIMAAVSVTSPTVTVGPSHFGGESLTDRLLLAQVFLGFTGATGLMLAAALAETQAARRLSQEGQARLRALSDNLPDGLVYQMVKELDGSIRFLYVSAGVERLNGVSVAEVYRDSNVLYGQILPEDRDRVREAEEKSERALSPFNEIVRFRRPDGAVRHMHLASSPRRIEDGRTLWDGIQTDVTEEETIAQAVRSSQEWFSTIFNASSNAVALTEWPSGKIIDVNATWSKATGRGRSEVSGKTALELELWNDPATRELCLARLRTEGAVRNFATTLNMDGAKTPYLLSAAMMELRGKPYVLWELRNISELKDAEAEQERLRAQLTQAQKMEAIGQLAGGIAHDFNNLLQVIGGYTDIALADLEPGHAARSSLGQIGQASERATKLVSQLLAFSRRQVLQMQSVNLNELVENLLSMLGRIIGEHIRLDFIPGHALGTVSADSGMLEQVLMNLAINARDAMGTQGILTIETGNVLLDGEFCARNAWAKPGRYVLLTVTDSGCGMDEETLQHLFEPFFTTKGKAKGTGLGLATVYGIIRQHNGMIRAYSEKGRGAAFKIYLPVTEQPAQQVVVRGDRMPKGGDETILLAEDDEGVRELAVLLLRQAGYAIIEARDGTEAVLRFEEFQDRVDMLLLDVVMPSLGGREVWERISAIRPGIPTLFSSGYSENAIHTNFVLNDGMNLIQKPYRLRDLLEKVRDTLDGCAANG